MENDNCREYYLASSGTDSKIQAYRVSYYFLIFTCFCSSFLTFLNATGTERKSVPIHVGDIFLFDFPSEPLRSTFQIGRHCNDAEVTCSLWWPQIAKLPNRWLILTGKSFSTRFHFVFSSRYDRWFTEFHSNPIDPIVSATVIDSNDRIIRILAVKKSRGKKHKELSERVRVPVASVSHKRYVKNQFD